jgi:hypothetical protein
MEGIVLCALALLCGLAGLVFYLIPHPARFPGWLGWGFWVSVATILYGIALLWGNVGVIYSHAGFTG